MLSKLLGISVIIPNNKKSSWKGLSLSHRSFASCYVFSFLWNLFQLQEKIKPNESPLAAETQTHFFSSRSKLFFTSFPLQVTTGLFLHIPWPSRAWFVCIVHVWTRMWCCVEKEVQLFCPFCTSATSLFMAWPHCLCICTCMCIENKRM